MSVEFWVEIFLELRKCTLVGFNTFFMNLFWSSSMNTNEFEITAAYSLCYKANDPMNSISKRSKQKLKPNYFKKQRSSSSFLLTWSTLKSLIDKHALIERSYVLSEHACLLGTSEQIYSSKMAKDSQQASPMSKMDGTRLPSTPWPFWTYICTSSK